MNRPTHCTCPEFNPEDFDGPEDHANACRDCPQHGTTVYLSELAR